MWALGLGLTTGVLTLALALGWAYMVGWGIDQGNWHYRYYKNRKRYPDEDVKPSHHLCDGFWAMVGLGVFWTITGTICLFLVAALGMAVAIQLGMITPLK